MFLPFPSVFTHIPCPTYANFPAQTSYHVVAIVSQNAFSPFIVTAVMSQSAARLSHVPPFTQPLPFTPQMVETKPDHPNFARPPQNHGHVQNP